MFSLVNASDASNHDLSVEYFYLENFFFNGFWDITLGKIDPLFLSLYTTYSSWDKYNYFSKSTTSDPVPDIDPGMGVFTEFNFTKNLSLGGMVTDGQYENNYLYMPDFSASLWLSLIHI